MNKVKSIVFAVSITAVFVLNPHLLFSENSKPKANKVSSAEKVVNNPIIQNLGVCDPHIHIFNNKAYLFASHDRSPNTDFYGMYDWWVWSSTDLVHWKMEFNLFPKDMWVGATSNAWAVDAAERNGKYYFYVTGNWRSGVAVSVNGPGGPYTDAIKKSFEGIAQDPTVFIDDDATKTPYLIAGAFPFKIAKLNEDMISFAEQPKELIIISKNWNGDGSFIHKRNGIYYLNGHNSRYATATNIYGPYTYRGEFSKKWKDHPTFFNLHNQTYCAFGTQDVGRFFRKTHMTYIHYKNNGDIYSDDIVSESFIGVGQYDCSKKIEAEWYFAASDGTKKQEADSGFVVSNLTNNASLYYQRILNMAANATISIKVASVKKGGVMEVRQDKVDGTLLGKILIPATGGLSTYETVSTTLKNRAGLNNIYLVYKGSVGNSANLDWLTISSTGAIQQPPKGEPIILAAKPTATTPAVSAFNQIEAEDLICYNRLVVANGNDNGPSRHISNINPMSYSSYMIDFGSKATSSLTFQARLSAVKPGSIEIRLDSITGTMIGSCAYESMESIEKWVTKECKVNAPTGVKHVFLVFKMGPEVKFEKRPITINLNWFKFVQ